MATPDYTLMGLPEVSTATGTPDECFDEFADSSVTGSPNNSTGTLGTDYRMSWTNKIKAMLKGLSTTRGVIPYYGASGWAALSPGTSGYVLTSNGAGADPSYQAASGGGGHIFVVNSACTAVANTNVQASLLSGGTTVGSLTFAANSLAAGNEIVSTLFGTITTSGTGSLTIKVMLGSSVIAQCTHTAGSATSGMYWNYGVPIRVFIQSSGATGKAICQGLSAIGSLGSLVLNASGTTNAATSQVTIDTTSSLNFDIQALWGAASSSNSMQILGGSVSVIS